MKTFLTIWTGNLTSLFGSGMVRFAIVIWLWQKSGKATSMALIGLCYLLTYIATAPVAGMAADRFSRKGVMIASYATGGLITLMGYFLVTSSSLTTWHLYLWTSLNGMTEAFYNPAYLAATTMMVRKETYIKISGMQSFERSLTEALAPLSAGVLLPAIGFKGIILIDLATFILAVFAHAIVIIPRPMQVLSGNRQGEVRNNFLPSLRYISGLKGLSGLLSISAAFSLVMGFVSSIQPALILARSGGSSMTLAAVQGAPGIGGIVGGILVSLWGGPKKRIHSCLLGAALYFIFCTGLTALGQTSLAWSIAGFTGGMLYIFIVGGSQSIWQSKVEPVMQGRIFAIRMIAVTAPVLVGFLCSGYLADSIFEPAMVSSAFLTSLFGWIIGMGPGAGMALMFLLAAAIGAAIHLLAYLFPSIRNVEKNLPDHAYAMEKRAQTQKENLAG